MPTVNVATCPICQQSHDIPVRSDLNTGSITVILTCPRTGNFFQGTIQRTVTVAPLPRLANLHQGLMPILA